MPTPTSSASASGACAARLSTSRGARVGTTRTWVGAWGSMSRNASTCSPRLTTWPGSARPRPAEEAFHARICSTLRASMSTRPAACVASTSQGGLRAVIVRVPGAPASACVGRAVAGCTTAGRRLAAPRPMSAAIAALYRTHWAGLVRLASLLTRDASVAEEIVQDSFVALHRRWGALADRAAAHAYLRTSVVNGSRSALRHRGVTERHRQPGPPEPAGPEESRRAADRGRRRHGRPAPASHAGSRRYWCCATTPTCPKTRSRLRWGWPGAR